MGAVRIWKAGAVIVPRQPGRTLTSTESARRRIDEKTELAGVTGYAKRLPIFWDGLRLIVPARVADGLDERGNEEISEQKREKEHWSDLPLLEG